MIQKGISLKNFTSYKIGGPAKLFAEFSSVKDLGDILSQCEGEKIFILGGGTNVLFDDKGFDGLVLKNKINSIEDIDQNKIKFGGGVPFGQAVAYSANQNLSGFEWAGGLPGTIAGAVRGNAGSFGGETKDNLLEVESFDLKTRKKLTRNNEGCKFGYRTSIFKTPEAKDEIIVSATFDFQAGDKSKIKEIARKNAVYRNEKQPQNPSAGSTFKGVKLENIPTEVREKFKEKIKSDPFPLIPAAVFIAGADLISKKIGGAEVSQIHPNFLVNASGATSDDVKRLIKFVQDQVSEKFKVELEPEIEIVGY